MEKASSTLRGSQAVPHLSTNRALRCLTAEFGRDPVCSTRYGRWRKYYLVIWSGDSAIKIELQKLLLKVLFKLY